MAERVPPADPAVDELRRKARRRLVGAIVLALAAAVILPMLLEKEPRPLGEDVAVRIPPVDDGKFVNRLSKPAESLPSAGVSGAAVSGAPGPGTRGETSVPAPAPGTTTTPAAPMADVGRPVPTGAAKEEAAAPDKADVATTIKPEPARPEPKAEPRVESRAEARLETKPALRGGTNAAESRAETKPAEPRGETRPAAKDAKDAKLAEAAPKTKADVFVVQLAAFSDDKGANALASKLKRNGYPAFTEPIQTSRGTLYRVRVGSYPTREAAGDARNKLKGDGYAGIVAPAH
ncbi:MAG: SPOR domain-containing protein [Casimicrobiaceae bacterium]